jgi:hypothetical protein
VYHKLLKEPFAAIGLDQIARMTDEQILYVLFGGPDPGPPPAASATTAAPMPDGPPASFRDDFVSRLVQNGRTRADAEALYAERFGGKEHKG